MVRVRIRVRVRAGSKQSGIGSVEAELDQPAVPFSSEGLVKILIMRCTPRQTVT